MERLRSDLSICYQKNTIFCVLANPYSITAANGFVVVFFACVNSRYTFHPLSASFFNLKWFKLNPGLWRRFLIDNLFIDASFSVTTNITTDTQIISKGRVYNETRDNFTNYLTGFFLFCMCKKNKFVLCLMRNIG